jgi:PAS domain S-box-containing protein
MIAAIKSYLRGNWQDAFFILLVCIGLYAASFYNGLLFHSLAEIFSTSIALGMFLTAWGGRRQQTGDYLLFLGFGLASASLIDIAHTLSYQGMNIFTGFDANLPTQLWIAARSLQVVTLLAAPFFLQRRLDLNLALAGFTITVFILVGLIFSRYFPDCYITGLGLTPFKITAEYGIIILLLAAAAHHYRRRAHIGHPGLGLLLMAIAFSITSEIMFMRYIGVFDLTNQIGHIFKVIAFWWFYHAAVQIGLTTPYTKLVDNLRQSEAHYRLLAENTSDVLYKMDAGLTQFTYISPSIERVLGYTPQEFKALPLDKLLTPDSYQKTRRAMSARLQEEEAQPGSTGTRVWLFEAVCKNNSCIWVEITNTPLRDNQNHFIGVTGVIRDYTERQAAEAALQRQNEYLVALQETALELISQHDLDILLENIVRRAGQLVGTDAGLLDLVDPNTNTLKPRVGTAALAESLNHPVQPGEGLAGTVWQTGTPLLIEDYDQWSGRIDKFTPSLIRSIVGVPLISEGKVLGVLGLAYDYNSQRAFAHEDIQLLQVFARFATIAIDNARLYSLAQKELEERKRLQAQMIESAKLAGLGTLAAGMAHEINSPLQVITGHTGSLLKRLPEQSSPPDKLQQDISVIDRSAWRIADIVRSLLLYAQPPENEQSRHDLNKIIRNALLLVDNNTPRFEGVEIKLELQPDLPLCPCNHANITQMLINLLSNAADACTQGGIITIRSIYESWQNMLLLEVVDTGSGIAPEIRERMFDPFFTTKDVGQGAGLGLSVVRGIVEAHGGAIDVHSDPQRGTVVRVHLPIEAPTTPHKSSTGPIGRFD